MNILREHGYEEALVLDPATASPVTMLSWQTLVPVLLAASRDFFGGESGLTEAEFWQHLEALSLKECLGRGRISVKSMNSRLSEVVFKMNSGDTDWIALQDNASGVTVAVITYLDILKYLIRNINSELHEDHDYSIKIGIPLKDSSECRHPPHVKEDCSLLAALQLMAGESKPYVEVRGKEGGFLDLLFLQDCRFIFENHCLQALEATVG